MNKAESPKIESADDVVGVIEAENPAAITAKAPAVLTQKDKLKGIILRVLGSQQTIQTGTTGTTAARYNLESDMIAQTLEIAGSIYSFASDNEDTQSMEEFDLAERDFSRLRSADRPIKIKRVLDKGDEIGDPLIPFGTTPEERAAARTLYEEYTKKITEQGTTDSGISAARDLQDDDLESIDKSFKILDKLMLKFKKSNPEFYYKYKAARVLKDKATRHRPDDDTPPTPEGGSTPSPQ